MSLIKTVSDHPHNSPKMETPREYESRFRVIFENSFDAILLTAPDGAILSANPAACRLFDKTEDEIFRLGRAGVVDDSAPRLASTLEERTRTGRFHGELTLVRKEGTKFQGEVSSMNELARHSEVLKSQNREA